MIVTPNIGSPVIAVEKRLLDHRKTLIFFAPKTA
jgi:hypothetical protein